MNYQTQPPLHPLQLKLRKISRQLQQLLQSGNMVSSKRFQSLKKRCERCLQQLMAAGVPLAKTGGTMAVAVLLATQVHAQDCSRFNNGNAANSLLFNKENTSHYKPAFVDIDGDGDLDCYATGPDRPVFYKNVGTKAIPSFSNQYIDDGGFTGFVGDFAVPQFADLDGDGDYDCFLVYEVESQRYRAIYYENVGTKSKPEFVRNDAKNPLSFIRGDYFLALTIADIDGDGDYDVFYSDLYFGNVYKNVGTKTAPQFEYASYDRHGLNYRIYYDWNKDGLIDYFDYGGGYYYRNIGPTPNDLKYQLDNTSGPKFGSYTYALTDINNDGVPEAFSVNSDLYTVVPVPVIKTVVGTDGSALLQATPQKGNYKYRWQRNGKDIPLAVTPVLPVVVPGYYTVTITNACGTGVSLPFAFKTAAPSFKEAEAAGAPLAKMQSAVAPVLKAYPNPFTQQFTLTLGNVDIPGTTVRITDVQGRVIYTVKATGNMLHLGETLQKGVYIVQVLQNNTVVFSQKMVKE